MIVLFFIILNLAIMADVQEGETEEDKTTNNADTERT